MPRGETSIAIDNGLLPLVEKLRRLGEMSCEDVAALNALPCSVRSLKHGEFVERQGAASHHVTLMLEGIATRDRMSRTGARQISGVCIRGDLLDLQSALIGCAHDNIQVFGTPVVARIPTAALLALVTERPAIGWLLWIDTLIDASIVREWTLNLGRRDARTRVLHLLCELAVRQQSVGLTNRELTLPLTQEQLGDALGLTAVHVNRMLQSLRDETMIERCGRTIRIRDWIQLTRHADFDDGYLRTQNGLS